jgi:hypothetical protein
MIPTVALILCLMPDNFTLQGAGESCKPLKINKLQLMCNMFVNAGRCTSRDTMPEMFALYFFRLILALGYCLAPNIVLNNQGFLD